MAEQRGRSGAPARSCRRRRGPCAWPVVREAFEPLEAAGGRDGTDARDRLLRAGDRGRRAARRRAPGSRLRPARRSGGGALGHFDPRWRGERLSGRLEPRSRRLVPYWRGPTSTPGASPAGAWSWPGPATRSTCSSWRSRGAAPCASPTAVSFASATRRQRPPVPEHRAAPDRRGPDGAGGDDHAGPPGLAGRPTPRSASGCSATTSPYVFFRPLAGRPVGSLGVPVTPGRSVATDHASSRRRPGLPGDAAARAGPRTARPVWSAPGPLGPEPGHRGRHPGRRPAGRLLGAGPRAEFAAGLMREPGRLAFLLPRPRAPWREGPA